MAQVTGRSVVSIEPELAEKLRAMGKLNESDLAGMLGPNGEPIHVPTGSSDQAAQPAQASATSAPAAGPSSAPAAPAASSSSSAGPAAGSSSEAKPAGASGVDPRQVIAMLEQELNQAKAALAAKDDRIEKLSRTNVELTKVLNRCGAGGLKLREAMEEREKRIQVMNKQLASAQQALKAKDARIQQLEEQLRQMAENMSEYVGYLNSGEAHSSRGQELKEAALKSVAAVAAMGKS
eukprot:tig00000430_g625.t1